MLGVTTSDHTISSLPVLATRASGPSRWPSCEVEEVRVRQQAAEIAAVLGPAALEIIAEFRAHRWAGLAARKQGQEGGVPARKRSVEWQRIAASVSMLILDRPDQ